MPQIMDVDNYDFILNNAGEVMLVMYFIEEEPSSPKAHWKKDGEIVLRRSEKETIVFQDIDKELFDDIVKVNSILVTEINEDGEFKHVYDVDFVKAG